MAGTARKTIRNGDLKKIIPVKQALELTKQVEIKVHGFECAALESIARIAENCCRMAEQWGGVCPGAISFIESGHKSLHAVFGLSHNAVEEFHKAAGDLMQITREATDCRSFDELYNLQRKAVRVITKRWLEELHHLNCALFGSYGATCVLPPD
ncbi:MAG: hypothetical protein ACOYNL_04010 [Rickettsiales bacterium]